VIKVLTRILQARPQPLLSRACFHMKGHGGLGRAVREVVKLPWLRLLLFFDTYHRFKNLPYPYHIFNFSGLSDNFLIWQDNRSILDSKRQSIG
jgi:hypothetical protein